MWFMTLPVVELSLWLSNSSADGKGLYTGEFLTSVTVKTELKRF